VLHDDGDRIGFGVESREQRLLGTLGYRALAKFLVIAKDINRIFQVRRGKLVRHTAILSHLRGLSSPAAKARSGETNSGRPIAGFAQLSRAEPTGVDTGAGVVESSA